MDEYRERQMAEQERSDRVQKEYEESIKNRQKICGRMTNKAFNAALKAIKRLYGLRDVEPLSDSHNQP